MFVTPVDRKCFSLLNQKLFFFFGTYEVQSSEGPVFEEDHSEQKEIYWSSIMEAMSTNPDRWYVPLPPAAWNSVRRHTLLTPSYVAARCMQYVIDSPTTHVNI